VGPLEQSGLCKSLRAGGIDLGIVLIELTNDLGQRRLIQIGRNARRSLCLCGGRNSGNRGRRRDEDRWCGLGKARGRQEAHQDHKSHSGIQLLRGKRAAIADPRVDSWVND